MRRNSTSVFDTLLLLSTPEFSIRRNGDCSMRLLTSAAARMSSSPIVRISSDFAPNAGVRGSMAASPATNSLTFSLSPGIAAASSGTMPPAFSGATAATGCGGSSVSCALALAAGGATCC